MYVYPRKQLEAGRWTGREEGAILAGLGYPPSRSAEKIKEWIDKGTLPVVGLPMSD